MSATLIFVVVVVVAALVLIVVTSVVGSRRRSHGRRLDGHVRGLWREWPGGRARGVRAGPGHRGALPRLTSDADNTRPDAPIKPERIAMEEVRRNLVHYDVPAQKPRVDPQV